MKNFYKLLILALIGAMSVPALATMTNLERAKGNTQSLIERSMQRKASHIGLQVSQDTPADAMAQTSVWGVLYHENGTTWYYTQTFEERDWYFDSSDITIYDNNFTSLGTIHVEIPEDMNVNDISPNDFVTTMFFDNEASSIEIPVFIHTIDNGRQICKMRIYRLDSEMILEYDSQSMIDFRASDNYMRVLLMNEVAGNVNISVLKGAEGDNQPTIEHTFTVDQDLMYYNNGPVINYYSLDGEPYYTISHFEKPCMDGYDMETYIPTQTPDNNLLIKTYDRNFALVDSLGISIDPTNAEATYGFASLGMLSFEDMRLGDFTNDDQRNYIIAHQDYFALSDQFTYYFRVYDSKGNYIKSIAENTTQWFELSDVAGHEQQMVFLKSDETGAQSLEMVDIPSCEVAAIFPAVVDGYQISTTMDRYPVGEDYQYVIGLSQADVDEDGNAIARIGWYKRDTSVDHYACFNLGKNAEGFTPYIAQYVLNPYLFNTDSKREYFYLAKQKRTDGSEIIDLNLYLADEDGNILRTIKAEGGSETMFSSGDVFDYNTPSPKLVLSFYNTLNSAYDVMLYNLPFDTFTSGGNGSAESPYIITTPGELAQMRSNGTAHYVLGNDIDMSEYGMPYFAPAEFSGSLDGNNYFINNIELDANGLLGNASQATIKNLQVKSPLLHAEDIASGIIANSADNSTIENVHIYDATISGDNATIAGGVVGTAHNTTICAVSVLRAYVEEYDKVGGIVATATGCDINAAVTSGICQIGKSLGGIAVEMDGSVTNSHTQWEGTATQAAGGIAVTSSASISNCYTQGNYELLPNSDGTSNVAGIAHTQQGAAIKGCVTTLDNIVVTSAGNATLENNYSNNTSSSDATSALGAYKDVEEMDRTFFEGLGYAYGNTLESPWMGEGLPILYFENDYQSVTAIEDDNNTIAYNGNTITALNATAISLYNTQGLLVATVQGAQMDVTHVADGIYIAVARDAQGSQHTRKIVVK